MFPDSEIACKMQLQRTKIRYNLVHGLGPHFLEELRKELEGESVDFVTVGFDESLNKVAQRIQMDIQVRFWSQLKNEVSTRYLTSAFLDHATALDLLSAFETALGEKLLKKLLQVSMDGPNVNHKFLRELLAKLQEFSTPPPVPLDLGSCGLHVLHGAFKKGFEETGWRLVPFLRAIYYFFKNFPARQATLASCIASLKEGPQETSGSDTASVPVDKREIGFPMNMCSVRWLENGPVAKRASSLVPSLRAYTKKMEMDKTVPQSKCFKTFQDALTDSLLTAKLAFFSSICDRTESFLHEFQTDEPYAPFLHEELQQLIRGFMEMFVKKDALNQASVQSIDISKESNLLPAKEISLAYAVRDEIKKCRSDVSSKDILVFRQNCRSALIAIVQKLLEKSPLKKKLTRAIACLDPSAVAASPDVSLKRLSLCLEELVEKQWLSGAAADKIDSQFRAFIGIPHVVVAMKSFQRNKTRLDHFWMKLIDAESQRFVDIKFLVRLICTLSHGNAFLERGFSVNGECMIENQKEASLVAQRRVYDKVLSVGGVEKFKVEKSVILAVRNSRARCREYEENERKEKLARSEQERTKKRIAEEARELKEKKCDCWQKLIDRQL